MPRKDHLTYLFFLVALFIVCFSSAQSVRVSPLKTELNFEANEKQKCMIIYVLPDEHMNITSKWSSDSPGEIDKYVLTVEKNKLKINYTKNGPGEYEFCFQPQRSGNFYGIIFFQPENGLIKMGSWINLNVTPTTPAEQITLIAGNAISANKEYRFDLMTIVVLLFILFIILLKKILRCWHSASCCKGK